MPPFTTGLSKEKIKQGGLIQNFILFDKVCTSEQLEEMSLLRERLRVLGANPLQNMTERMIIAKEIFLLRRQTSATITSDMLFFNELI